MKTNLLKVAALEATVVLGGAFSVKMASAGPEGGHGGPGMAQRFEHMASVLGLSDAQKTQVKSVFEGVKPRIEAIKNDTKLSREQKHEQIKPIFQSARQQVEAILTPEQRAKLQELQAKRQAEHPEGGPGGRGFGPRQKRDGNGF